MGRHFAKEDGFLLRLQINHIARGTPWIWMMERLKRAPLNKNTVISGFDESEVLLPPGYFKVLFKHDRVYDVAFVAQPGYVRRGSMPKFNTVGPYAKRLAGNTVVARTIGGHRLEVRNRVLANNVRARLDAKTPVTTRRVHVMPAITNSWLRAARDPGQALKKRARGRGRIPFGGGGGKNMTVNWRLNGLPKLTRYGLVKKPKNVVVKSS